MLQEKGRMTFRANSIGLLLLSSGTHGISPGTHKLTQTPTVTKKINKRLTLVVSRLKLNKSLKCTMLTIICSLAHNNTTFLVEHKHKLFLC